MRADFGRGFSGGYVGAHASREEPQRLCGASVCSAFNRACRDPADEVALQEKIHD